jgi:hypothetical protein
MEQKSGKANIGKFLKNELDSYVSMRSGESRSEPPMYLVEDQQYIYYNKGAVVMYGMADRIGDAKMNQALSGFLQAYKFTSRPYANTLEFLPYLQAATPDSLKQLVTDWFMKVTLYDNKVTHLKYTKPKGNIKTYKVDFDVETAKLYDDGKGVFSKTPMTETVEIVVFGASSKGNADNAPALYSTVARITNGKQHFTVVTDRKPDKVGVDPYFKLVDKDPYDNVVNVAGSAKSEATVKAQ